LANGIDRNIRLLPGLFGQNNAEAGTYVINHLMLIAENVRDLELRSKSPFRRRINRMRLAGMAAMACSAVLMIFLIVRLHG
jgi:hypothetical protein